MKSACLPVSMIPNRPDIASPFSGPERDQTASCALLGGASHGGLDHFVERLEVPAEQIQGVLHQAPVSLVALADFAAQHTELHQFPPQRLSRVIREYLFHLPASRAGLLRLLQALQVLLEPEVDLLGIVLGQGPLISDNGKSSHTVQELRISLR